MKFTFKFLLANGGSLFLTFTANELSSARENALSYAKLAFRPNEVMDFYLI